MQLHKQSRQLVATILSVPLLVSCASATASESFKVMSFNILWDGLDDSFGDWNFDPAGPRRDRVAAILDQEEADLIGLQEVGDTQLPDLVNSLPGYDYV